MNKQGTPFFRNKEIHELRQRMVESFKEYFHKHNGRNPSEKALHGFRDTLDAHEDVLGQAVDAAMEASARDLKERPKKFFRYLGLGLLGAGVIPLLINVVTSYQTTGEASPGILLAAGFSLLAFLILSFTFPK